MTAPVKRETRIVIDVRGVVHHVFATYSNGVKVWPLAAAPLPPVDIFS